MNGIKEYDFSDTPNQEIREILAQIERGVSQFLTAREALLKELDYWLSRDGYSPRVNPDNGKPGERPYYCTLHGRLIPSRSKVYRVSEISAITGMEVKRRDLCPQCAHTTPLVETLEVPIAPAQ